MSTQTTATVLIGRLDPWMAGASFRAEHLLVLDEGFRAGWTLVPIASRPPRHSVRSTAKAPDNLLCHALVTYLASTYPESRETVEVLDACSRRVAKRSGLKTDVPDGMVTKVVTAMPDDICVVVTLLRGSTVRREEAERLSELVLKVTILDEPKIPSRA